MIKINEDFTIEHDRNQYILKKTCLSKESGEPYEQILGYWYSLAQPFHVVKEKTRSKQLKAEAQQIIDILANNFRYGEAKDLPSEYELYTQARGTLGIKHKYYSDEGKLIIADMGIYASPKPKSIGVIIFHIWFKHQKAKNLKEVYALLREWQKNE